MSGLFTDKKRNQIQNLILGKMSHFEVVILFCVALIQVSNVMNCQISEFKSHITT
jgi:putative copper export protein